MWEIVQPTLIVTAILVGVVSIAYFYFSADIFVDVLKRPLQMISVGMLVINLAVALVVFIAYESSKETSIYFLGMPLSTHFYIFYFLGSSMIVFGSRKFSKRFS